MVSFQKLTEIDTGGGSAEYLCITWMEGINRKPPVLTKSYKSIIHYKKKTVVKIWESLQITPMPSLTAPTARTYFPSSKHQPDQESSQVLTANIFHRVSSGRQGLAWPSRSETCSLFSKNTKQRSLWETMGYVCMTKAHFHMYNTIKTTYIKV